MIKLFVSDIDNTLLNTEVGMPEANFEAILELQRSGVKIVLASGRINVGMLALAEKLQLKKYGGFIVASNGAYVLSVQDGEVLMDCKIPLDELKELTEKALSLGIHVSIQQSDFLTYTALDEAVIYDRDVVGLRIEQHIALNEFLYEPAGRIQLSCWMNDDPTPFDEFTKCYDQSYSLIRGRGTFMDVMANGVTKASGVAVVMAKLGLKRSEVAAIGDGENDRHMLKAAGLSATLMNARLSLQTEVDHVVASVEHAGLAHFAHIVLSKNAN